MNSTMQAIVQTKYGAPDVLQLQQVAKPVPADNEVLIKIHATTVEASDVLFRQGSNFSARMFTGPLKPKITRPGSEFAGEIVAVGKVVTRFKVGDQVFGTTAPGFGAHAGYLCLAEDGVMTFKPANLSYAESVSIHPGALTALPNLRDAVHLQPGQNVLINGASGSIGTSAASLPRFSGRKSPRSAVRPTATW